jgi:hypothetical protein
MMRFRAPGKSVSTAGTIALSLQAASFQPDSHARKRSVRWRRVPIYRDEAHRIAKSSLWASPSHRSFDTAVPTAESPR